MRFFKKDGVYIIAEIGSNHQKDLELAKKHIEKAKEAGADCVKFQSLDLEKLYFNPSQQQIELHKKIDLDREWLPLLKAYCDELAIDFCSSPTYFEAVEDLENIGVKFHKIASAQVGTFPQIIEKIAKLQKPVLFSTGLVGEKELDGVVLIFKKAGNENFTILHCNSIYPTPYEKVNLKLIEEYRKRYGCDVGFSDHTMGIHVPLAAVSLGATVIEKHFKIDDTIESPDAPISISFKEFKKMVESIRDLEKALQFKRRDLIEEDEQNFKEAIRYKLILIRDKKDGECFGEEDFGFLRAEGGIDVSELDKIIGEYIPSQNLEKNTILKYENLKSKKS